MYVKITPDPSMISFQPNIAQPFKARTKSNLQVQIRDSIDVLFQEYQKSINGNTHDAMIGIDNELNLKMSKRSIPEILMEKPSPTPLRKCNDMNGILGKLIIYIINFANFFFMELIRLFWIFFVYSVSKILNFSETGGSNAFNYISFILAILTLVVNINNNINNNNNNLNQFNLNIADNNNANANVNNNNANVINVMPPGRKKRSLIEFVCQKDKYCKHVFGKILTKRNDGWR